MLQLPVQDDACGSPLHQHGHAVAPRDVGSERRQIKRLVKITLGRYNFLLMTTMREDER